MGYRIDYAPKRRPVARWVLLGLLVGCLLWPRGRGVLKEAIFPGDLAHTGRALEAFARELGAGEPLGSALEGFCRQILEESP